MFRFLLIALVCAQCAAWDYSKVGGFTASSCESLASDSKCLSDSACSWCTSAAVGDSCMDAEDAQGLPSAVFTCSTSKAVAPNNNNNNETLSADLSGLFGKTVPAVIELDINAYKGFWYQVCNRS